MSADAIPPAAAAVINLGFDLEKAGRYDDAIATLRAGLERFPGLADIQWRLGLLLLREGEFEEGWKLYEARPVHMGGGSAGRPRFSFPEWTGGPIASLLIMPEQGLAEQVMFARYAAHLRDQGVAVSILCPPNLGRLFQRLGQGIQVVLGQGRVQLPQVDAWALGPSLPGLTGVIPARPYLHAAAGGHGVGLVAQAGPNADPARDMPGEVAAELAGLPDVQTYTPMGAVADVEDVARFVESVAAVVTVDSVVAHVAGAMGKRCVLVLPFVADWRWMRDRADSAWYPSITLVRQPAAGDWSGVSAAVKRALSEEPHG